MLPEVIIVFNFLFKLLQEFWWLIIFVYLTKKFFKFRGKYLKKLKKDKNKPKEWVVLEIKVSNEFYQTPKLMEQFFVGLHALAKGYLSLEVIGNHQKRGFYICVPKEYRQFVESQIYARYPVDVEIEEVRDYLEVIFPDILKRHYNIWGAELIFAKDDCYPLKTHPYFDEEKEEKRIESMTGLMEGLNKLKEDEWCGIQIIIQPTKKDWPSRKSLVEKTNDLIDRLIGVKEEKDWIEKGNATISKLIGRKTEKKITNKDWFDAFIGNLVRAPYKIPEWPTAKKDDDKRLSDVQFFSPGMRDVVKEMENKVSKLGFETGIRLIYIAPENVYSEIRTASLIAYFKQFNTENLNSLKIDKDSSLTPEGLFKTKKEFLKKIDFYEQFCQRKKTEKSIVLNTEELATIYHFPFTQTKIPALDHLPIRKGEPPSNLPIA